MNKGDLIDAVAAELGGTKVTASRAVDAMIQAIAQGIRRDGSVTISGFGSFQRKVRAARTGRSPKTREPIEIPASTTVGFRPSQHLRQRV